MSVEEPNSPKFNFNILEMLSNTHDGAAFSERTSATIVNFMLNTNIEVQDRSFLKI